MLSARPSVGGGGGGMYTPIDSITPYQNKWQIKARVTSKSDIRTWNNAKGAFSFLLYFVYFIILDLIDLILFILGSGKLFSMDLMDESGEIRATAFKEQCDMFYDMIQVGKVFLISNCQVKAANKQYSKLRNDYELTFKDNVIVQPCDEVSQLSSYVVVTDQGSISWKKKHFFKFCFLTLPANFFVFLAPFSSII